MADKKKKRLVATKKVPSQKAPSPLAVKNLQERVEHLEAQVLREQEMVAIYESQIVALRDKLHAVCLLVGDLKDKPENCLRDRVTRLEEKMGLAPADLIDGRLAGDDLDPVDLIDGSLAKAQGDET